MKSIDLILVALFVCQAADLSVDLFFLSYSYSKVLPFPNSFLISF